jgi:hypothetical protein
MREALRAVGTRVLMLCEASMMASMRAGATTADQPASARSMVAPSTVEAAASPLPGAGEGPARPGAPAGAARPAGAVPSGARMPASARPARKPDAELSASKSWCAASARVSSSWGRTANG